MLILLLTRVSESIFDYIIPFMSLVLRDVGLVNSLSCKGQDDLNMKLTYGWELLKYNKILSVLTMASFCMRFWNQKR